MKKKPLILKILTAKHIKPFALKLEFSDGCSQTVDFESFLKKSNHPDVKKYLKPANFSKFKIEQGELMWGDFDLIFPIMDLYENRIDLKTGNRMAKEVFRKTTGKSDWKGFSEEHGKS